MDTETIVMDNETTPKTGGSHESSDSSEAAP